MIRKCHSERNEGSCYEKEILRFAQNDSYFSNVPLCYPERSEVTRCGKEILRFAQNDRSPLLHHYLFTDCSVNLKSPARYN